MLIYGSVHRVVRAYSRRATMLLVRVADKTIKKRDVPDGDDDAAAPVAAAAADDDEAAEYARLRQYIIVHERDIVPAYDSRLEYVLDVERLAAYEDYVLNDKERTEQAKPKRLAPDAAGHALIYRARACTSVTMTPAKATMGVTVARVRDSLPPFLRPLLARAMYGRMNEKVASLDGLAALLARLPAPVSEEQRYATMVMFADTLSSASSE